jgi:putative aldouronate transport system substrate-binding protein
MENCQIKEEVMFEKKLSRRKLLAGLAKGAGLLAAGPVLVAGARRAVPASAAADPWAIYPMDDPRHWVVRKMIEPPKKYRNLVITQNFFTGGDLYKEGESPGNSVQSRWLEKEIGVQHKAVWSGANMAEYWPTALASGDLPEFITSVPQPVYLQLLEADRLVDIREIWEKTASPLTKKKKHYPDAPSWKVLFDKGRLLGIGASGGALHNGTDILWVRQDWLDRVKMRVPETLDEAYETGRAFMREGLSKFGIWVGNRYSRNWGTMSIVFGAFGNVPQLWRRGEGGKLTYSSLDPAMKDGLAVLAKWYKDGVLDREFLASFDIGKYIGGNMAGMAFHAWWGPAFPLGTSMQNDPNARWTPAMIPAGPTGKRGRYGENYINLATCFRKGIDPTKIEAIINELNWWYEIEDNNESGNSANVILFMDYDYVLEGGEAKPGKYNTRRYNCGGFGFEANRYPEFDLTAHQKLEELAKQDRRAMNPIQRWQTTDPKPLLQARSIKIAFESAKYAIINEMWWPTPSAVTEIEASLLRMEDGVFADIITGRAPVGAWDRFAQDWRRQGGDRLTDAINAEDAKHT